MLSMLANSAENGIPTDLEYWEILLNQYDG